MKQRQDTPSMFWPSWIHYLLSFMGNVDFQDIISSDLIFYGYKLEEGRWTHCYWSHFQEKWHITEKICDSSGVENRTSRKLTVSQPKGDVCPHYYSFTFISLKKTQRYAIISIILWILAKMMLCWGGWVSDLAAESDHHSTFLLNGISASLCMSGREQYNLYPGPGMTSLLQSAIMKEAASK